MSSSVSTPQPGPDGLLWAYNVDSEGIGTAIKPSAERSQPATTGFNWYHLQFDAPDAIEWMRARSLSDHVIDVLTADETRPKVITLPEGVLVVLRGVNTNPGAEPEDMVSIRLWVGKGLVVSARKSTRRLLSAQDVRLSIENATGPKNTGEFITALVEKLADRIGDVVDEIDDELTRFETDIVEGLIKDVRRQLPTTRRRTAAIRRFLAPQRDALEALCRGRGQFAETDAYELHQQTDRMTRYVEDLDLARERALVLQEELHNRAAEQQNARMYVLSVVAAIFLPLSFLTGVFGMNVAGLPGVENPAGFLYVAFGMLSVAFALVAFMRWRKWI